MGPQALLPRHYAVLRGVRRRRVLGRVLAAAATPGDGDGDHTPAAEVGCCGAWLDTDRCGVPAGVCGSAHGNCVATVVVQTAACRVGATHSITDNGDGTFAYVCSSPTFGNQAFFVILLVLVTFTLLIMEYRADIVFITAAAILYVANILTAAEGKGVSAGTSGVGVFVVRSLSVGRPAAPTGAASGPDCPQCPPPLLTAFL